MLSADFAPCNTISVTKIMDNVSKSNTMIKQIDFPGWLQKQMDARKWGQADLANAAGINRQVIWGYLNRSKKPSEEILVKLAHALEIPPQEIFRAAGILPAESNHDAFFEALKFITGDLDTNTKNDILEYAKLKRRLSGKG
jgi:transcriptional regulator with XRE-family HTH domain